MIDEITLRNVALIREASMMPARGLTVITGESGSGKTAFLSGLKLLVGERASADMVRDGAALLEVEGRFFPLEGGSPDDELIALRTVAADGRSRVRLNGSMASVGDLAERVGAGVDLCGQHEHQQLMKAANQARMLDDWIGEKLEPALGDYRNAWREAGEAHRQLDELRETGRADTARLDEARFVLDRIDALAPAAGEYEELLAEARRLEHVEDLARNAGGAHEAISGEGGALDAVNQAISMLQAVAKVDARLANSAKALAEACFILEDASREIDAATPDSDAFDPMRLEELQNRIASLQGLMRSYGPTMEDVLRRRDEAAGVLEAFSDIDGRIAACERRLKEAEARLAHAADALSKLREAYAPRFAAEVNGILGILEMPGCALSCTIERMERPRWGLAGPDQVSFSFRPAPDAEARPLSRIASGGELSRVTLAVKVALGRADQVDTLVFDEVDAGVGGKAALAVGGVLKRLAETHQVIVVTHLAQIAVLADAHFVVERAGKADVETRLREVADEERVREVARMLSGAVDNASMAHAAEMLRETERR